jgi:hypothetical protein
MIKDKGLPWTFYISGYSIALGGHQTKVMDLLYYTQNINICRTHFSPSVDSLTTPTILESPSATLLSNLSMGIFWGDVSLSDGGVSLCDVADAFWEEVSICRGGVFASLPRWLCIEETDDLREL